MRVVAAVSRQPEDNRDLLLLMLSQHLCPTVHLMGLLPKFNLWNFNDLNSTFLLMGIFQPRMKRWLSHLSQPDEAGTMIVLMFR